MENARRIIISNIIVTRQCFPRVSCWQNIGENAVVVWYQFKSRTKTVSRRFSYMNLYLCILRALWHIKIVSTYSIMLYPYSLL